MAVLHGTWGAGSRLCVWGEEDAASPPERSRVSPRPHPFASGEESLRRILAERATVCAEPTALTLLLPSRPTGPLPSPELGLPTWTGTAPPGLRPWTVPALALEPDAALDLLLAPAGEAHSASLRFLGEAAKLALDLVARGRVLPALESDGARFAARWRVAPEPEDVRRFRLLAAAMPPVCRAEAPGTRPPAAVVEEVVGEVADAAARRGAFALPPPSVGGTPAAEAWVRALTSREPCVEAGVIELAALQRRLDAWSRPAEPATDGLRLCFRIMPPEAGRGTRPWRVEFLLQAPDDPSLLVPAAEVWRSGGRLVAFERVVEHPQERLLGELGRACLLAPALDAALATARPTGLPLDAAGAHRFLREDATVLAHSGFGVLVPPWWHEPQARLGLRLRARPAAGTAVAAAGPGKLGLEALCEYEWEVALGDTVLRPEELRELARLKVPLVQVRGRWVELGPEELTAALALLDQPAEERRMTLADLLRASIGLDAGPGPPVVAVEAEGWVRELLAGAAERRFAAEPTPAGFHGDLRPYQERGLAWLRFLGDLGLGACLADDMGLGKTIQLLAMLVAERDAGELAAPTLLVCPMSVVGNWQREAERFAPQLRVHVHHGQGRQGGEQLAEVVRDRDLVITTYGLAVRDQEALSALEWGRVVLDEAQNVKNSAARQAHAVRALRAPRRVALTGTPVENRLAELWSIMQFLNPGLLGSASDFRRRFSVPVERYRDDEAAALLRKLTGPFVLRRLKTDRSIIADLPDKVDMKVYCNITREQATLYQAVLDDMLAKIDAAGEDIERRGLVLATMMKLKQVLNHPRQLLRDGSRLDGRSGKLARLEEILEEVMAEGDRALLFTQFAEMGDLLRAHLRERLGRDVPFLHGGTPRRARDEMVAWFQSAAGPPLLILSLKAGGTGLNLTAANHVIHFDRWWNPAVEDQATDRAFRIGQRRDVQVRKLVCIGTLEERIDRMIEEKRELARRIVGTGEGWLTELSTDQLRELVALCADAVAEA